MNVYLNKLYLEDVKKIANCNFINFNKLKNKKILITGATGLICSFLIDVLIYRNEYFNENISIYMMCRDKNRLIKRFENYDIKDWKSENSKRKLYYIIQNVCDEFKFDIKFDYIIHGASNTHPRLYSSDPIGTITTNILGMNNILKYSIKNIPTRILLMSSVEIYGENKGDTESFDEKYLGYIDCNTVRAGYPESKRLCEALCQAYINKYNLDIVITRLSRVYGPTMRDDDSKALAQFIRNAVNNENIVLKSKGNQYYSYLYVADTVSAILKVLLDGKNGEAYNVGDKSSDIKLKDLANILANFNFKDVVYETPDENEKKGYSTATIATLKSDKIRELGWTAVYGIKDGLKRTVEILKQKGE